MNEDCTGNIIANPEGVGEAFFYQASPSDDVFALVTFSSEIPWGNLCPPRAKLRHLNDGEAFAWKAFVSPRAPPPSTCEPVTGEVAYNPSGVRKMTQTHI